MGWVLATSRGRPRPFLDDHGHLLPDSISEKAFVEINGLRQRMFIKGRDVFESGDVLTRVSMRSDASTGVRLGDAG